MVKQRNKKARGVYEKTTKSCDMYVIKTFVFPKYYMYLNKF